jgi:hypothetical protein
MLPLVSTNLLQASIDTHCVHFDQEAYMLAEIFVRDDTLENWKHGHILLTIISVSFNFATCRFQKWSAAKPTRSV